MVLITVSLDEIQHSPSSTFYKLLEPYYKPSYEPNERIVLENFGTISIDFLMHVFQVISSLDISPFFITVRTNQPTTREFFESLPEPIRVEIQDKEPNKSLGHTVPVFNNNGKMCAHAWGGFHVATNGEIKVCCEYTDVIRDNTGNPFNIRTHDIDEILDSEYMIGIRQQFRSGQTPKACAKCEFYEKHNGVSKRSLTKFKLSNLYHNINWEDDRVTGNDLFVGGHLGNTCNLKCRICSEKFSSQIAVEKIKIGNKSNINGDPIREDLITRNWKLTDPYFWARLKSIGTRARNFEFLGGEPLLLEENLEFMQHLIDTGHSKNCIFEFITNGTQYPSIFDNADKFQRLTITVSIDDIGPRFEYQRKNAKWTEVAQNLKRFVAIRKTSKNKIEIGISITVNIQNVLYLPELINWLRAQDVDHYFFNVLVDPYFLSIENLTPTAKELAIERLLSSDLSREDKEKLSPLIATLRQSSYSDGKEFCQYIRELDIIRNENFSDHHKAIADAMGYKV